MAKPALSTKHLAINKANAQMVAIVAVAAFVSIFCLVATKAAWDHNRYQAKVTEAKEKANNQLKDNVEQFKDLQKSYNAFDRASTNVIGGISNGNGDKDGKNSKIILDALPSSYDFPALASSLEKILATSSVKISSIGGTDDELNQQINESSPTPTPLEVPFTFQVQDATYASVMQLMANLQRSIRPIQVDTFELHGGSSSMELTVTAHTYYQPSKSLNITKKVIK